MLALLAVLAFQAQDDELEQIANVALVKARECYENKKWFDSIEQAERARNIFQSLVDLYDKRSEREKRDRAAEQVKICNQLIKLASDKRKAEMPDPPKAVEPPKPEAPKIEEPKKEEPPKVEEPPKIDPNVPPESIVQFGRFLGAEFGTGDADKIAAMLKALRFVPDRWKNLGTVALTVVMNCADGSWVIASEDRPALKEYAQKYLIPAAPCDDRSAAMFLAKAAESVEPLARWRLLRVLALAHAAQALKDDPDSPIKFELTKTKLDIVEGNVTAEGAAIEFFRALKDEPIAAWKKAPKARDPIRDMFKGLSLIEAISECGAKKAAVMMSDAKPLLSSSDPAINAVLGALKAHLDKNKVCRSCDGECKIRCGNNCDEDGKRRVVCAKCGGKSFLQHPNNPKKQRDICREPPPAGHKWEKEGHFCLVDCPGCKGKAYIACNDCKSPWNGSNLWKGLTPEKCTACDGGWLLEGVKLPCFKCSGMGQKVTIRAK